MLENDQHVVCDVQQSAAEWNREINPSGLVKSQGCFRQPRIIAALTSSPVLSQPYGIPPDSLVLASPEVRRELFLLVTVLGRKYGVDP